MNDNYKTCLFVGGRGPPSLSAHESHGLAGGDQHEPFKGRLTQSDTQQGRPTQLFEFHKCSLALCQRVDVET